MTGYRLKLAGLSSVDEQSIKSMLRLSSDLLTSNWEIVNDNDADLTIYSFESDAGIRAWEKRNSGFTALLSNTANVTEPVDVLLKKPLRKSNFSDALNLVLEKIAAEKATHQQPVQTEKIESESKNSSWLSRLVSRKKPSADLPALHLGTPDNSGNPKDTIKDARLLNSWIEQLPKDTNQQVGTLLTNLQLLNKVPLKAQLHLELLEIYRSAARDIIFTRDIAAVKRDLYVTSENLKAIRNISDLIEELANGYKKIIAYYYDRGETPVSNKLMLLCINRAAEQIAQWILHAFHYYRSAPKQAWYQLHQFYLYLEAAGVTHELVEIKEEYQSEAFYSLYLQIMLTAMSDPYSLAKFEVLRLFQLMTRYIDKTEISLLTPKLINTNSEFMLTGHFCIDADADTIPVAMSKTPVEIRSEKQTRLLNIQPLILEFNTLLKQLAAKPAASLDIEQKLLKKIMPQLNTSYERRYHRLNTAKYRSFVLANGIKTIHQTLNDQPAHTCTWKMANQSSNGIMAYRDSKDCLPVNIGDFIGLFEAELSVKLAFVRWLHIDVDSETFIGLELIEGKPSPALCMPDGQPEQYPALLMPSADPQDVATLYTEKGLYSPKRKIRIKEDENTPYIIIADKLLSSTLDYELFSYKLQPVHK